MPRKLHIGVQPKWVSTPTLSFTTGTGGSVNLAAHVNNPRGYALTFSVASGTVPNGLTISGSSAVWSAAGTATGGVYTLTFQFTSSLGTQVAPASSSCTITNLDTTAPPTPANLRVSGTTTSSTITMAWDSVTDPAVAYAVTSGLAGYRLYRGGVQVYQGTGTTHQSTGLSASTQYTYTIAAYDNAGNASAQSAGVAGTTQASSGGGYVPLRTLYVNNVTGSDTNNGLSPTNQGNGVGPFATIGRATRGSTEWASPNPSQAAIAGDLVSVAFTGNPYNEVGYRGGNASLNKSTVMLQCANSGTAQDPITIRGSGGKPEIRAATALDRGGAIGSGTLPNGVGGSRSHIIWDGFTIDDYYLGSGSDFGPVVLTSGTSYCQIINCEIRGHTGSYFWGHPTYTGNYRGVAMEYATYCTIRNNKIWRFTGGTNECAIFGYDFGYNTFEQNTIWGCGGGIFIKGEHTNNSNTANIVRRNLIYSCNDHAVRILDGNNSSIYQNILINPAAGGDGTLYWHGSESPPGIRFYNNVLYGGIRTIAAQNDAAGLEIRNNIVQGCTNAMYGIGSFISSQFSSDRNCYFSVSQMLSGETGENALTFADWRNIGKDPSGINQNPLFIDPASRNFRLQAGSPALTLGRDYYGTFGGNSSTVIPAGAYVTGTEQIGADW